MTRSVPYLAELQPEMFCEVSPGLAEEVGLEHGGWATIWTVRAAIEARVLVTERMPPVKVYGRWHDTVGPVPRRAPARDVLRGVARTRGGGRARARGLGDHLDGTGRDRSACARHGADAAGEGVRPVA